MTARRRLALLLSLLPALLGAAPPDPGPLPPPATRTEPRLLLKENHLFATVGATVLRRGDFFDSPGLAAAVAWFPRESWGLDLHAAWFDSTPNATAREVLDSLGWVPDAPKPVLLVLLGWR